MRQSIKHLIIFITASLLWLAQACQADSSAINAPSNHFPTTQQMANAQIIYRQQYGRDLLQDLHSPNGYYRKQAELAANPTWDPLHPRYTQSPLYNRAFDREQRLRQLAQDPKVGTHIRDAIRANIAKADALRDKGINGSEKYLLTANNPVGFELAHQRGHEFSKGYGYAYANLQNHDLHMLQHTGKLDGDWPHDHHAHGGDQWGKRNKERVPPAYQAQIDTMGRTIVHVYDQSTPDPIPPASP